MSDDSIEGIYDTLKQCALISKSAGGIGLNVHCIRATGSYIAGVRKKTFLPLFKKPIFRLDTCEKQASLRETFPIERSGLEIFFGGTVRGIYPSTFTFELVFWWLCRYCSRICSHPVLALSL